MTASRSLPPTDLPPDVPTLIAAAPVIALHQELRRELDFVTARVPGSDLCRWLTDAESRVRGAIASAAASRVMLTSEEVAELIDRTPARVRQLCESGVLESQRAGNVGPYRITKASVDRYLMSKFARRAA